MKKDTTGSAAAFSAVIVLFIAVSTVSAALATRIDREVVDLQTNSLPSVQYLFSARADLDHMESDLAGLPGGAPALRAAALADVRSRRQVLADELRAYSQTPWYAGERERYEGSLLPALARLDEHLSELSGDESGDHAGEQAVAAVAEADRALEGLLDLNHRQAFAAAGRVLRKRQQLAAIGMLLNAVAVTFAALLGVLSVRASRRYRRLAEEHASLLEARTQELEVFAERVAHDILSPLAGASYSLRLIEESRPDPDMKRMTTRGLKSLERSRRLVQGILEFSRSGGRPSRGATAHVPSVVQSLVDEIGTSPDAPAIKIEALDDCEVACDPSVLGVILGNLLNNAVKYTKDSPVRAIAVRVRRAAGMARVEVQDSGPGVPDGLEKKIFEPYVRGPLTNQPGLGIGLATVQRFVTRHGGRVGVERPEVGSVFWFVLPLATSPPLWHAVSKRTAPGPNATVR